MIVIDLCKANYKTLLITYLELTIRNANHAWKKKSNQYVNLLGLKIIDWITNAKNVKKFTMSKNEGSKNFPIMHQFWNGDLDNSFLLLRKLFDETSIPPKETCYSKLNEKGISDADYAYVQKVWEVFEIKNLGKYHDLCVQYDTLLLADALWKL